MQLNFYITTESEAFKSAYFSRLQKSRAKISHSHFLYPLTICSLINFKICLSFFVIKRMRRKALSHATSNVVGALLRLCLVTAGRQGIVKGEGSSFASTSSSNCKQTVIQASSPLTKKQNFKFLKNYFANFKISFTRKN